MFKSLLVVVPVRVHQGLLESARNSVKIAPDRVSRSTCRRTLQFWFVVVPVVFPTWNQGLRENHAFCALPIGLGSCLA